MKKIVLIILLLFTINVYAGSCDSNEFKRLKALAEKIEFTYDYDIEKTEYEEGLLYDIDNRITASNLNSELKVLIYEDYYKDIYKEFKYNSTGKSTLSGFNQGEKVVVTIEGYVNNECSGKTILTKTINIPYYNTFYDGDECKENKDFIYCKNEMTDNLVTRSAFNSKLNEYLSDSNIEDKETNNNEKKLDITTLILIISSIAIILALAIIIKAFRNERKRNSI